jgi:hypothetical protein
MPVYELINPSDCCTFEAPDDRVATMVTLLLGRGMYGAVRVDGSTVCHMYPFGLPDDLGHGLTPTNLGGALEESAGQVADALDSLLYAGFTKRSGVEASGVSYASYNESRRTSLTDIAGAAKHLSEALRTRRGPVRV